MAKMTIAGYAKMIGVSAATVRHWIRKGAVSVTRLGPKTHVRVLVSDDEIRQYRPLPPIDPDIHVKIAK